MIKKLNIVFYTMFFLLSNGYCQDINYWSDFQINILNAYQQADPVMIKLENGNLIEN